MTVPARIAEGLRLLRLGREEAKMGRDLGLADLALRGAVSVLQVRVGERRRKWAETWVWQTLL